MPRRSTTVHSLAPDPPDANWLTVTDVADELQVSPKSIYKQVASGKIPDNVIHRVGRAIRIHRSYLPEPEASK